MPLTPSNYGARIQVSRLEGAKFGDGSVDHLGPQSGQSGRRTLQASCIFVLPKRIE